MALQQIVADKRVHSRSHDMEICRDEIRHRILLASTCRRYRALLMTTTKAEQYWEDLGHLVLKRKQKPTDFATMSWYYLVLHFAMRRCVIDHVLTPYQYIFASPNVPMCFNCCQKDDRFAVVTKEQCLKYYLLEPKDLFYPVVHYIYMHLSWFNKPIIAQYYRRNLIEPIAKCKHGSDFINQMPQKHSKCNLTVLYLILFVLSTPTVLIILQLDSFVAQI